MFGKNLNFPKHWKRRLIRPFFPAIGIPAPERCFKRSESYLQSAVKILIRGGGHEVDRRRL